MKEYCTVETIFLGWILDNYNKIKLFLINLRGDE